MTGLNLIWVKDMILWVVKNRKPTIV
jgi:hypothetical protein